MKKNLLILAGLVLMAFVVFAGGGQQAAQDDSFQVGYVINNFNDTFQTYIKDAAEAYINSVPNVTISFQDAQEDVIRQQDLVNTFITQGVDALIVVPVDTNAMTPIIRAAAEANIPLAFVNRNPFGENQPPANVYYVGSQEIIAGQLQGEAMGNALNGRGGVVILMGQLTNEGAVLRTAGNEQVLAEKFPNVTVLAKETGNWQRDQGLSLTENWLTAYGAGLNGILANNDEMALGAVEALRAAGRTDVVVMGVDAIPDAKAAVGNGSLAATVLQDAVGQGGGVAKVIHEVLEGKSVAGVTWVPFVLVNKDNLSQFP